MKEKKEKFDLWVLFILVFTVIFAGLTYTSEEVSAASIQDIKIACAYPMSGPLSRNGNFVVQGIKAAMGWVNDNGGIKSLGGAKLVPIIADSGSTPEGAASAMARLCKDPDIVMAMGSWAGSLTLASTEVTERLGIPHFSTSWIDKLHQRGFKWAFYVNPPSSRIGYLGGSNLMNIYKELGGAPKTFMCVSDTMATSLAANKAAMKYFMDVGVKLLGEERFTMGTLTDATPIVLKMRHLNPDLVLYDIASINENQVFLMKIKEMGTKFSLASCAPVTLDPSFKQIGGEFLEGLLGTGPSFYHKLTPPDWIKRSLDQCRKEYVDVPWMVEELNNPWLMVPIMAEILERAGSRDHQAIWEAGRKLDIHNVMATRATAGQGMAFDENGRIVEKYQSFLAMQWQQGIASTVFPPHLAMNKPILVKK
jgi:branched-chain amino acid transport system substrate-binding protein